LNQYYHYWVHKDKFMSKCEAHDEFMFIIKDLKNEFVLHRAEMKAEFISLRKDNVNSKVNLAKLNVKSGIWGLIGGLIPVIIGFGYIFFKH
jgi:hypothetical protein